MTKKTKKVIEKKFYTILLKSFSLFFQISS